MELRYTLAFPEPETHLYEVTIDVAGAPPGPLRLAMPAWAPGSYLIRDFARHVQDFAATDASGQAVPWTRVDKQTWEVAAARKRRVTYRVWANELSVQTSHLDATHAFGNGTNLLMYVDGHKDAPATLRFKPPRRWAVDIALPEVERNTFRAKDYDDLADAPFECGTHRRLSFRAAGVRHRIALYGKGNEDEGRMVEDLQRIVEEEAAIFGGLPYKDYLFIIHLSDRGAGGLEHRGSNVSAVDRWTFQPGKKYEDFLALEAHEFFHTWNVKRIRPRALGPFDYSREVHTTLLWAMEGLTSYYDHLVLARTGIITEDRYREFLGETLTKLRQQPGRLKLSLAQSSFLTWIKLYKQDANWPNTGISYYLKGELVGLVLDLAIRERTRGRLGLDDMMRVLWRKYPAHGPGIPEPHMGGSDGWRETLEELTGLSWSAFWKRNIEGTSELDVERALKPIGWRVRAVRKGDKPEDKRKKGEYDRPGAWLGIEAKEVERRLRVAHVLVESPALAAGIAPDDELVALDGYQLKDKEAIERRLREREPGDVARLHVFRRGELVALDVALAESPPEKWVIEEFEKPTAAQRRLKEAWLAPLSGRKGRPRAGGKTRTGARKRVVERGE